MSEGVTRHPAEVTVAAFVEGTLSARETTMVAAHLRDCRECRGVVAEAARFHDAEAGDARKQTPPARTWWLVAAAVIAAVVAVPLFRRGEPHDAPAAIAALIQAAPRDHRLVRPRVSGFQWAPLRAPSRGSGAPPDPGDLKLGGAAGEVLERTQGKATSEAQHAAGVAYLMIGRGTDSIGALERATASANDARIWNDLAAARYVVGMADRPSLLPEALAAADRALRIDPRFGEAQFNRALILEAIGERNAARAAWTKYLELDPNSGWSAEAREHLRRMSDHSSDFPKELRRASTAADVRVAAVALVRRHPDLSRRYGEGPLLAEWAEAELAAEPGAAAKLALVRAIGNALQAHNGERLLADAITAIDRAPESRRDLATAHQLFHLGRLDHRNRDLGNAETKFRQAAELFRRGDSVMEEAATYWAAAAAFERSGSDAARREIVALQSRIDRDRHRALAAQIHWELALAANIAGDWGTAIREADAAEAIFHSLGDRAFAAEVNDMATAALDLIGERDAAWRRRVATLHELAGDEYAYRRAVALHGAAITSAATGHVAAAEALLDLVLETGGGGNAVLLAEALGDRVRLTANAENAGDPHRRLDEARAIARTIRDLPRRAAVEARIELAAASLQEPAAPATFDRLVAFFKTHRQGNLLPEAHLQRARAHRARGDDNAAAAAYAEALREVQQQRSTIGRTVPAFIDTAALIIEESIELELARGRVADAFAISDRARGGEGRAVVAPGIALVEYTVLPKSVAIFCATSEGIVAEKTAIDRGELSARVARFAEAIRRRAPAAGVQRQAQALHAMLIAPLRLSGIDELVLVPDRELHAIPFAALFDGNRYLIEDFALRFAPSSRGAASAAAGPLAPALVVADPPTERWPRLEHARKEAEAIAARGGATLLSGEAATRSRFAAEARRSALIHFAGHADSDATESYGALLLADGPLGSSDIARLRLELQPLVILAACGTFRGDPLHVEGMASLARAFLTAGARGVIGTLWEIDDDVAAPLLLELHDRLGAGALPARALRSAQLAMLLSPDPRLSHPAAWSSYALAGN